MESGDESEKCRICLSAKKNRSVLSPCKHEYCYDCILQWSRRRNCCPLCNARFTSLSYNIKSENEYEVRRIPYTDTIEDGRNRRTQTSIHITRVTRRWPMRRIPGRAHNTQARRTQRALSTHGRRPARPDRNLRACRQTIRVVRMAMQEIMKTLSSAANGTAGGAYVIYEEPNPMITRNISRIHRATASIASASRAPSAHSLSRIPSILWIPNSRSTLGDTSLRSISSVESVSSRSSSH